ncbi:MAG TPA: MFS transporter [Rubrivivax sp.]|nr:MFS transporter [Burkholderiales bacterium]HNT38038.1 MFS transporter [Rubrivivax sp.]
MTGPSRTLTLLLNTAHALDHFFLLIFATAVAAIAADFGFAGWEDLMPYGVGAFVLFGLGSAPAGRLGDLWGRRRMMLLFFFGIGASSLLAALTRNAWQLAAALTLLGAFSAIYHPVGIPMLLQHTTTPGRTIGWSGLAGNLGVAVAAGLTGLLVSIAGWRWAFAVPGLLTLALGLLFMRLAPHEAEPPARRRSKAAIALPTSMLARVFAVMTAGAIASGVLFNFMTNGNGQLMAERLHGIVEDPSRLGALLAAVYAVASVTQLVVGKLIDRYPIKPLYLVMVLGQVPLLLLTSRAQGWWIFAALLGTMAMIFGAVPFTDAMIARYVDDRLRSRVAGMRLTVAFGFSSAAVWLLGPMVKANGFGTMLIVMAGFSLLSALTLTLLPSERHPALQGVS